MENELSVKLIYIHVIINVFQMSQLKSEVTKLTTAVDALLKIQ